MWKIWDLLRSCFRTFELTKPKCTEFWPNLWSTLTSLFLAPTGHQHPGLGRTKLVTIYSNNHWLHTGHWACQCGGVCWTTTTFYRNNNVKNNIPGYQNTKAILWNNVNNFQTVAILNHRSDFVLTLNLSLKLKHSNIIRKNLWPLNHKKPCQPNTKHWS